MVIARRCRGYSLLVICYLGAALFMIAAHSKTVWAGSHIWDSLGEMWLPVGPGLFLSGSISRCAPVFGTRYRFSPIQILNSELQMAI